MDKKIEIRYNKDITLQVISEILKKRFPEYDQSIQTFGVNAPFIRLKKSMFVHVMVFVKQKESKQKTIIGINGGMSSLGALLFGFLMHYIFRGTILNDVETAIKEELI